MQFTILSWSLTIFGGSNEKEPKCSGSFSGPKGQTYRLLIPIFFSTSCLTETFGFSARASRMNAGSILKNAELNYVLSRKIVESFGLNFIQEFRCDLENGGIKEVVRVQFSEISRKQIVRE